jgi:hypothetical protein
MPTMVMPSSALPLLLISAFQGVVAPGGAPPAARPAFHREAQSLMSAMVAGSFLGSLTNSSKPSKPSAGGRNGRAKGAVGGAETTTFSSGSASERT